MFLSLGILILNQISQIILANFGLKGKRKNFIFFKSSFLLSLVLIFSYSFFLARNQFFAWYSSSPSKYLIPPYNEIWYFLHYAFTHFFLKYSISFVLSLFFFAYFFFLSKRRQEKFFEREEIYIASLAIFLLPHPLSFVYVISIFVIGVISSLVLRIRQLKRAKQSETHSNSPNSEYSDKFVDSNYAIRFPFYYFWFPVAILTLLVFLVWKMI